MSITIPHGGFRVISADPPWQFGDKLPGPSRGASKNYSTLTLAQLCDFHVPCEQVNARVPQVAADDCVLFMWRVSSMQEEALQVVREWGFKLKTELVWIKQTANGKRHFGMGRTLRAEHETCLIATRGRPQVKLKNVRSTFTAPYTGHSRKPDAYFAIVESLFDGPYLELFARERRPGWQADGDQLPEIATPHTQEA